MLAHAKWFIDETGLHPPDLTALGRPAVATSLIVAVLLAVVYRALLQRGWLPLPQLPQVVRRRLLPTQRLVAVSVGVLLLFLTATQQLLAPNLELGNGLGRGALTILQGGTGLMLLRGFQVRSAALALTGLVGLAGVVHGPVAVAESAHLLGAAAFLAAASTHGLAREDARIMAARGLRWGFAVALVAAGLSEKLLAPGVMLAALEANALFALLPTMDGTTSLTAVRALGGVEVLLGLLLIHRATPAVVVLALAVPFIVTIPFFGVVELVGHLPVVAGLVTLAALVAASDPPVDGEEEGTGPVVGDRRLTTVSAG